MREIGTVRAFETGNFEVVENNIIPEKEKMKFIMKLNLYTLLMTVVGIIIVIVFMPKDFTVNLIELSILLFSFLIYVIVHELLHGMAFMIWNKTSWNQIKFGLVLKSGMAYCISKVPVKVNAGRVSLMMPVYIVCIPMLIIAFVLKDVALGIASIMYLSGSTGDFYYMWKLRHTKKDLYMHEEMPTASGYEVGYLLYKKLD
ncbi:hypothetical protein KQ51_00826 [Candidatus Izimaplasma bacterium HR1]|uniref:DUF3267 domain-containing protein n=1 Tax=Candidatus Izimoplasma sp. HR1 TaxID=1541959 RepID=UPI0004F7F3F7|nr:hypothetical protein KQ51_00826 [Candidatus Izimaplasma bacterium HR1]